MSIKRKLILAAVCIAAILVIFTVNIIRHIRTKESTETKKTTVKENVITRAEAYRLLSYISYDKTGREILPMGIIYTDKSMSGWYDGFVNAVWKMGLIEGNISVSPNEALTYGTCKEMLDKLIIQKPEYQGLYNGLSFDFMNADDEMLKQDFLELYDIILKLMPDESRTIEEKTLFVIDREVSQDKKDRIVTDLGRFYYANSMDYEKYFKLIGLKADINDEEITGDEASKGAEKENKKAALTDDGSVSETQKDAQLTAEDFTNTYLDKCIKAVVCGQEIIYITGQTTEKTVLHNVWIKQGKSQSVNTFINGVNKTFKTQYKLSSDIDQVIGDISMEDRKIVGISVKPDLIHGKVLLAGEDFIEVDGYGKVPLDKDYKIYKLYGELSMEQTNSILVGYETTDFVVSDGKISAALIRESIKAENIRVLLHTTDFEDIYHKEVELTSDTDFTVKIGKKEQKYKAGDKLTVKPGDEILSEGRLSITSASEGGKLQLLSVSRYEGNPKYRGSIEIAETEQGLLVVNELPLEEYLYAVVPSEMPTYFGPEALKVQAVCARSYAYRQLLANSLSSYGAHVDDSVSYQVYNNIEENEDSILAVKDTYGKVVEYNGDVITAYYFSTSCGHTTGVENVWADGEAAPYLSGRLMAAEKDSEGVVSQSKEDSIYDDLSKEENFRSFISDKNFKTYDSGYNWYRWKVTIDTADIKKTIDNKLKARYDANPDLVKTLISGSEEEKNAVYESIPIETVGDIVDIYAKKRGNGGIICELIISGTKNTIKVQTEYNIRALLSPINDTVYRLDESGVDGLNLLPSAFFIIDPVKEDGKLKSITLTGGGYGHGVGMSQNGVKSLADTGKTYEDIIAYFYEGTTLGFIYE